VHEEEVQRRPPAIPERRDDDFRNRFRADQTCNGLVLEERLAVDVRDEAGEQKGGRADDGRSSDPASASR
jgi:hypothetical protein